MILEIITNAHILYTKPGFKCFIDTNSFNLYKNLLSLVITSFCARETKAVERLRKMLRSTAHKMRARIPIQAVYPNWILWDHHWFHPVQPKVHFSSYYRSLCITVRSIMYIMFCYDLKKMSHSHNTLPRSAPLPAPALSRTGIGLCVVLALFRLHRQLLTLPQSCCFCSEVSQIPAFPICPSTTFMLLSPWPAPPRQQCPLTSLMAKVETDSLPLTKAMQNKKPTRRTFLLLMPTGKEKQV